MALFNYFGLSYLDIVNSFNGAISTDFATNGYTAQQIIEREMDFAESKIIGKLDAAVIDILSFAESLRVDPVALNGSQVWTSPLPILDDFVMYVDSGFYQTYDSIGCSNAECDREVTDLTLFTDYTRVGNVVTFGSTYDSDNKYYASFSVDADAISIPSLSTHLSDIVCCSVGHQLYSRQGDTWKLVDQFCKWAENEPMKIPAELRKLSWFKYPFQKPWASIKTRRVN